MYLFCISDYYITSIYKACCILTLQCSWFYVFTYIYTYDFQDLYPPLSEEGLRTSHDNMRTLMEKLAQLSESIERLHTNTSSERKISSNERKISSQSTNQRANENFSHSKFQSGNWNQHTPDSHVTNHHSGESPVSMPHHSNCNSHISNSLAQHTSPGNSCLSHGQHSVNRLRNSAGTQMGGLMKNGKLADS